MKNGKTKQSENQQQQGQKWESLGESTISDWKSDAMPCTQKFNETKKYIQGKHKDMDNLDDCFTGFDTHHQS